MTQRKALLNAVANATTETTQAQATQQTNQLTAKYSASYALAQQEAVPTNRQAISMINFVGADEQVKTPNLSGIDSMVNFVPVGDQVTIGGKTCGIEGSGIISDTYINNVQDKTLGSIKIMSATSSATTYKGMSPADLHKIKQVIYNLHHQNDVPPSGGNGGGTPEVPGGGNEGGSDTPDVPGGGNEGGGDTPEVPGGGNEGGGDTPDVPGGGNEGGGDTPEVPGGGDEGGGDTPEVPGGGDEGGSDTPDVPGGGDEGGDDTPDDPNYKSFITTCKGTGATFDTVNEMFTVLEEHGIDTSKGISRADLVKLSQDDTWEDSHWDFFGCLNRIFDVLDGDAESVSANIYKDGDDGYLSKEELMVFFPDGKIDENSTDYLLRVLEYSQKIDEYYQSLSDKDKVQYAIDKTRQYLEARGMQAQIDALDRLLAQKDYRTLNGSATSNDIIFGNLVFADLGGTSSDGYTTLGAYAYFPYLCGGSATYTVDGKTYDVSLYGVDHSTAAGDGIDGSTYIDKNGVTQTNDVGLTLNSNDAAEMLNKPWYYIVDTLVHELTHATAYQYVNEENNPSGCFNSFNYAQIEQLYNEGLITASEWGQFKNNQNVRIVDYDSDGNFVSLDDSLSPLYRKLMYLTSCKWGEYAAYQADADFIDSIGGDVMNGKVNGSWQDYSDYYTASDGGSYYVSVTTAANGTDEASVITSHILKGYGEQEALPNFKWWTNGDEENGILA